MVGGLLVLLMGCDVRARSVPSWLLFLFLGLVFVLHCNHVNFLQFCVFIVLNCVASLFWLCPKFELFCGSADLFVLAGISFLLPTPHWHAYFQVLGLLSLLFSFALLFNRWPRAEPIPFIPLLVISYAFF